MAELPAFEDGRREAYKLLGDAEDWLRSDWRPGSGQDAGQAAGLWEAKAAIRTAKESLNSFRVAAPLSISV